ncbi:1,4-dihydroxy-2-naphthoyl-CoA synthase, partial [Bacillus paranthracis]|nr:1,4-dihydroxy-2-naphthoyl-CoA synthase [Bacillus paranthracis]
GIQQRAGDATLVDYTTDAAKAGRDACKEKGREDLGQLPSCP